MKRSLFGHSLNFFRIIPTICVIIRLVVQVNCDDMHNTEDITSITSFLHWKFSQLSTSASHTLRGIEEDDELSNNAPILPCGSAGGAEDGQYIELLGQAMDPPCEIVKGYCRLKRKTNYTAVVHYIPKVHVESLSVRVTAVDRNYGWVETSFWPEYEVCGYFNMTCPMEPDSAVRAWNRDDLPDGVPPTRGLFRVRLMGKSIEQPKKRIYMCRQIYLQLY